MSELNLEEALRRIDGLREKLKFPSEQNNLLVYGLNMLEHCLKGLFVKPGDELEGVKARQLEEREY